jgi:hypothetical protein
MALTASGGSSCVPWIEFDVDAEIAKVNRRERR